MKSTLEEHIQLILNYCKTKKFKSSLTQNYITDALNRFIFDFDDVQLIDCIKFFHQNDDCQRYFNELVNKYDLTLNETNRLLLIESIYLYHHETTCNNTNK